MKHDVSLRTTLNGIFKSAYGPSPISVRTPMLSRSEIIESINRKTKTGSKSPNKASQPVYASFNINEEDEQISKIQPYKPIQNNTTYYSLNTG